MKRVWSVKSSVGVFAITALFISSPSHAQNTSDPQSGRSSSPSAGDIVVTAQRRVERLQDVPVSVSVISGASLANQNLNTLEDVSARMPNVRINAGPLVDQITVRGVGSGQNPGFEQSVATFVDGVYRSRSRSSRAALFDVDRIEILKGPQTTFFGANAIAGALNITSRKPGDRFGYNGSALYAFEDGEYNVEAGVDLPASDVLAFRVAGRASGMDGYVRNDLTGKDGPHDRTYLGRISARFQPTPSFRSDFRFDAMRQRTDDAFPLEITGCPPTAPLTAAGSNTCARYLAQNGGAVDSKFNYHNASGNSFANYDFYEAAWTNSLDVGPGELTTTAAYFHHEFRNLVQQIPFPLTDTVGGYDALPASTNERFRQFSQELRYQTDTGGLFDFMLGGYYSTGRLKNVITVGFYFLPFGAFNPTGTTDAATPVSGRPTLDQSDRTLSTFGSLVIRPADGLRFNLGARYTNVRKKAVRTSQLGTSINGDPDTFQTFDLNIQAVFAAILGSDLGPFTRPRRTDDKFMPSIGVQYDLAKDVMAYATYSTGFKAGGYGATSQIDEFNPETVDAYEVGLKALFLDRRLTLNTAIYQSDYNGLQEAAVIPGPSGLTIVVVRNAASSRSQGVEFSANYRASPMFTLSSDIAYLDAKYLSYPNGSCSIVQQAQTAPGTACVQNLAVARRPYAPSWSGNVTTNVTLPVTEGYELRIDPTMYFTSKFFQNSTADPLVRQEGNAKFDLRIGFGPGDRHWEVTAIGKNLTNKLTAGFRSGIALADGTVYALPDRSRSIALQITIKN